MDTQEFDARLTALRQVLVPPARMRLPEFADDVRYLPKSSGAVGGKWRTARVNVARGPMMAVGEPGVQVITCMVATQLLKTELLLNTVCYFALLDPCPMLLVQPKDEAVDSFSKERLAPMISATPDLQAVMGDVRTRRSEDTLRFKSFPGGFLALASAGSPTNLAMRAIRVVLMDEVDKYEANKEGDPILLAEERSSTFRGKRLSLRVCSPTWEETSRIWKSYQDSDQRRPFVPCPHCGEFQDLEFFRHVHWDKKSNGHHNPASALVYCEHCGASWSEAQRLEALQLIEWRQTRPFYCCGNNWDPRHTRVWEWNSEQEVGYAMCPKCRDLPVTNYHAGFTASKLYDPNRTMAELATLWLEAKKDLEGRVTFYNTQLALPYRLEAQKEVNPTGLAGRAELWEDVPDEVLVITAGVDVHPGSTQSEGRIELEAVGWGLGEESWSLGHEVFTGDPAQDEVWDELDDYLLTPMRRQDGRDMHIKAACVDSGGHNTQEAYRFCLGKVGRNVWAIKGSSDRGGQWSPIWPSVRTTKPGTQYRGGYRPIIIGVNAAKEAVRQRLLIAEAGPGYCHFPAGRPSAYYDQLASERLELHRHAGQMVRRWVQPSHLANEALDLRVYAYAALWGLYVVRRIKLETLEQQIRAGAPAPPPVDVAPRPRPAPPPPQPRPRVRLSQWARG